VTVSAEGKMEKGTEGNNERGGRRDRGTSLCTTLGGLWVKILQAQRLNLPLQLHSGTREIKKRNKFSRVSVDRRGGQREQLLGHRGNRGRNKRLSETGPGGTTLGEKNAAEKRYLKPLRWGKFIWGDPIEHARPEKGRGKKEGEIILSRLSQMRTVVSRRRNPKKKVVNWPEKKERHTNLCANRAREFEENIAHEPGESTSLRREYWGTKHPLNNNKTGMESLGEKKHMIEGIWG